MNIKSVYFFNSLVALEAANTNHSDGDKYFFFYDGTALNEAPINCINVPIASFYDFFLQTTYPQISQLNFDNVAFSDDIKSQITQNITQTITAIKNQKIEIINSLIPAEIDDKNIGVMIFSFLKYLLEGADEKASAELIIKLLQITTYLQTHKYELTQQILNLQTQLFLQVNTQKIDMNNIFLTFILKQLKNKIEFDKNREECLKKISDYDSIPDIFINFHYVKYIYQINEFKNYINIQAKILFKNNFFDLDIIKQKEKIFKFFFTTNYAFKFFEDFKEIYIILHPLYLEAIKREQDELVMFLYYPLQFSWNGVAQTQEEHKYFNDEIERPLEQFVKDTLIEKYKLKANKKIINPNQKKIKVAILIHRILNLSVNHVMMSLLEAIKKDPNKQYEFIIYDMNVMELMGSDLKKVEELKKLGFKYVDLHYKFYDNNYVFYPLMEKALKTRKLLIKDKIDILIGYHNRAEYNFLFTSRTAPKQVYWSHGNYEYHLDNIDIKFTNCAADKNFKKINVYMNQNNHNPKIDTDELKKTRELYPKDVFILGSIGRLVKIDNEQYLRTIATLLEENPNTIYLACGAGDNSKIKEKINELGIQDRFYFTGLIDAHIYGHIIDFFPDTFPMPQGESLQEFMRKKSDNAYMTLKTEEFMNIYDSKYKKNENTLNIKLRQKNSRYNESVSYIIENYGEDFTVITSDIKIYIERCNQCIKDTRLREALNYRHNTYIQEINSNTVEELIDILENK